MIEVTWRPLIYLDANVFIDAYEGEESLSAPAKALIDELRKRPGTGVTSELTLAEVLVRPETERNLRLKRAYLNLIVWGRSLDLIPISREVPTESAKLRAVHPRKLRLADAIHLATAAIGRCKVFVSRDGAISTPVGMRKMQPDREGVDAIIQAIT